jgi:hypothetical protein
VRCASTGAERRGGGLCAHPAYVAAVLPSASNRTDSIIREKKSDKKAQSAEAAGTSSHSPCTPRDPRRHEPLLLMPLPRRGAKE